jgi:sugar phosphate isomerase/epimerase
MLPRRIPWLSASLLALLASGGAVAHAAEPPWTALFDGKSIDGWIQRGGKAAFAVEAGTIVGTSVPSTPNSFLCTPRSYGDFVLEYEFKVDEALNSGVQIRSQSSAAYQNGRVHGYQVEIDPAVKRDRMWSGGLYDEGRRGWLADLTQNEPARKAFKPGVWNHIRVEAFGDRLRTWINGVAAADIVDSVDLEGFIALQVHGVKERKEALHVAWRGLRVQDWGNRRWLPASWMSDGKTAFRAAGGGSWSVVDGVLVGVSHKGERRSGLAFLPRPVGDFTARLEYRVTGGNAGLYFRAQPADTPAGARGLQADLDARGGSGGLYGTGGRGWIARAQPQKGVKPFKEGDFDVLTVSAHGGHVVTHVDGVRMAVMDDAPAAEGLLALELAGGEEVRLEVRRLELLSEPLPPPLPGLAVGYTGDIKGDALEQAKAAGFEFADIDLGGVVALSDEEFAKLVTRVQGLGLPVRGAIHLLPNDLKVVGPAVDKAKQREALALARALGRAAKLGARLVVFGASASRKAPDGFASARAFAQLVDFGRRAAVEAKKHGITLLVKAFRREETNTINSTAEALELVQAVAHPNFELLVDAYQMALIKEDPAVILQARRHIRLVQIANPAADPPGRAFPFADAEWDYAGFFRYLVDIGYQGGISIEGRAPGGLAADAPRSIALVRRLAAQVGLGVGPGAGVATPVRAAKPPGS